MKYLRDDEPDYAFLPEPSPHEKNQWGKDIQTVPENHKLAGQSLNINGSSDVGENSQRYKQHGFHFTADNCIACHACEAACSEKNDLPAHISFRSVGYLEGGSYPAYKRLNISMACNHCDNPVCLKGCPTRAYTKYAEYGAVLQDPDICFGCGYCTWVCPYNAPQLDPIKGQVSKCNMCVDRLEEGLKPACAAACLGGALDFGVIESAPLNRDQTKLEIPGFPTPEITHPNIRFQQTRNLPRTMSRPDSMPLKYHRTDQSHSPYEATAANTAQTKAWSLRKLRSREDPLVVFTLLTQAVVGAFGFLFIGIHYSAFAGELESIGIPFLLTLIALQTYGLFTSTMHLGKPHRFYRAFNNLRRSPVSREVAAIAVFFNLLLLYTLTSAAVGYEWVDDQPALVAMLGWSCLISGLLAIYAMHRIYRIKARPFWNHWQVLTSFYGSVFSLGALLLSMAVILSYFLEGTPSVHSLAALAWFMVLGIALEGIGLIAHKRYLKHAGGEASAAMHRQEGEFAYTYQARNLGLSLGLLGSIAIATLPLTQTSLIIYAAVFLVLIVSAVLGRALFYVLVIPTTMPGAFFWKNRAFQEHAIETGMSDMPQVGVVQQH